MEQILVTRVNGSTYLLEDRNAFRIIQSINQKVELRTNDTIEISVESRDFFSFTIGDSFNYLGEKYTLNQIPKVDKISSSLFKYAVTFEGIQFDLRRVSYDVNIDTTGSAIYGEALTANLELFLRVLVKNANRVFPDEWVLGNFPAETETKTLTFSEEENCLNVLQTLCTEYDYDFVIKTENNVNTIHIQQVGQEIPLEFKVGFQKGLYSLTRDKVDTNDIVTRLKVYGSDRNLGTDYRSNRLVLAGTNKPNSYIDNTAGIAKYGIYEQTKIFEEIYPRRKGKVTAINSDSILKFTDSSMDFNLKERDENGTLYLLNGVSAKIHFNTGNLAGYEFEISDYNHDTKEFSIIKFTDENDYQFPASDNDVFRISIGDEYVILDIKMPQAYIDAAEAELLEKGTEFLTDKQEPLVQYTLDVDTLYLQRQLNETVSEFFSIGDFVKVVDEDLELNRYIRIKAIERDLTNPFDYKLTLSDAKVTTSIGNTLASDINTINNIIRINHLNDPARAKRNWKDAQEVLDMVFDVEGDYYTEKIKPNSIETMHLQVGAKSMQFNLVESYFSPNYNGNPNLIAWTSCKLVHFTIDENIKEWQITAGTKTLAENKPYYMYARCNKNNNIGVIEITENQYRVDNSTDYFYFLIGIINSYDSTILAREISLMYGFTTVSGRFVKTGRIQSTDGQTYFDLDSGEIKGKITFTNDFGGINLLKYSNDISRYWLAQSSNLSSYIDSNETIIKGVANGIYPRITTNAISLINFDLNSEYCLSFYIKGKPSTRMLIASDLDGANSIYEFPNIEITSEWAKKVFVFRPIRISSINSYLQFYTGDHLSDSNSFIEIKNIQIEKGSIASDYSPSLSDFTSRVSFLSTTIDNNIIATGLLMVGSGDQSNAGISGYTDRGVNSIRFWAGSTALNRNNARWSIDDNGFERCYHSNGILASERGYDGDKWVYNMYNDQGWSIFQLDSRRGLIPTVYTEESFTPSSFINTNQSNADFNTVRQDIINLVSDNSNLIKTETYVYDGVYGPEDGIGNYYAYYKVVSTKLNVNLFDYYNGSHPNNTQYESLKGWKKTLNRNDNVNNGWYIKISTNSNNNLLGNGYIYGSSEPIPINLTCVYINNGQITQNQGLTINM